MVDKRRSLKGCVTNQHMVDLTLLLCSQDYLITIGAMRPNLDLEVHVNNYRLSS